MRRQTDALAHLRLATRVAGLRVGEIVAPDDCDIVVKGMRLHYLDWGRHDRPPLVFLHGGCLTAHTWDLVCLALRADYHCLAIDQRGHGDSEWSPSLDYGPEAHARDIGGLIEKLQLKRPILIGHSLGGLNAMTYAAHAADALAGIVMVDIGPGVGRDGVRRIANFVLSEPAHGSVEEFVRRARAFNPRRDTRLLRYSILHNLRRLPDGTWTWKYDRRAITPERLENTRRRAEQLRKIAHTVACPVLIVRGAASDSFTDAQASRFAASLPDARWTRVENAGHTVQGDNPAGLVQALSHFLAEIGT